MSSSTPSLADDIDGIRTAIKAHESSGEFYLHKHGMSPGGFPYPPDSPMLWIKFDVGERVIRKQAEMQSFLYENLKCPGIRIPQVYRLHEIPRHDTGDSESQPDDWPWYVLVMEYIKAEKIKSSLNNNDDPKLEIDFIGRVADALTAMASIPPPPGAAPGPANGGRISSLVWSLDEPTAPREFDTVQELQDYINDEIQDVPYRQDANFVNEPFFLCHGDIHFSNFLVADSTDPKSDLIIIDFEFTNWLPASFLFWEIYDKKIDDDIYDLVLDAVKSRLPETPVNLDNIQALNSLRWKRERELKYRYYNLAKQSKNMD